MCGSTSIVGVCKLQISIMGDCILYTIQCMVGGGGVGGVWDG